MNESCSIHYEEDALPGFSEFRYLTREGVNLAKMQDFGYVKDSRSKFNSFARRFRLAKSMKTIQFEGYGEGTGKGYEALNRHFLMFSAFERYAADCEGIYGGVHHRALKYASDDLFKEIREAFKIVDINDSVFNFLIENSSSDIQKRSLLEFRRGESNRKGIYISAMLRNCYAHGVLTAHPQGAPAFAIQNLSNFMASFLYRAIVQDFQHRLDEVNYEIKRVSN